MRPIYRDLQPESIQNYETGLKQLTHLQPWDGIIHDNLILVSGQRLPFKVSFQFVRLFNSLPGKIRWNYQCHTQLSDFTMKKYTEPDRVVSQKKLNNTLLTKKTMVHLAAGNPSSHILTTIEARYLRASMVHKQTGTTKIKHTFMSNITTTTILSAQLLEQINNKIKKSKTPKHDWGYDFELSSEQIDKILKSQEGQFEVCNDIEENNADAIWDTERQYLRNIVSYFTTEICEELDWDEDDVTTEDIDDIIQSNEIHNENRVNINLEQIIINTTPKIVLRLDLHHEYEWGDEIEYEQVEDILELLGINPKDIDPNFPDHPTRIDPIIKPADLLRLWRSAHNGGQYILALDFDLNNYIKNREPYHKAITIQKGSYLRLHDYWNGSSSAPVQLQQDLTIIQSEIAYTFKEDRQSSNGLTKVFQGYTADSTITIPNL